MLAFRRYVEDLEGQEEEGVTMKVMFGCEAREYFLHQLSKIAEGKRYRYAEIVGALKAATAVTGDTELYAALERATGDGEKEKAG